MKNLKDYTQSELEEILLNLGEPKFRAKQIFKWLYDGAETYDEMTNIPKNLKEKLSKEFSVNNLKIEQKFISCIAYFSGAYCCFNCCVLFNRWRRYS